jgi:histone demethylase JARID1
MTPPTGASTAYPIHICSYGARNVTALELERDYWRIVENAEENVQVYYGSDVDVQKHGSLHPTDRASGDPLALHGWNPNNLPHLQDCMLRLVDEQVPGVTHPMVYIGMMFSTRPFRQWFRY